MDLPARLSLLLVLLLAAPAHAARVSVYVGPTTDSADGYQREDILGAYLRFTAEPGERNRVTITSLGPRRVRLSDAGAPVTAGRRCRSTSARAAVCRVRTSVSRRRVVVRLGDGDDRLAATGVRIPVYAFGRAGDDRLAGGLRRDYLDGGGGADRIDGGPGADTLRDGFGRDRLAGGPGRDVLLHRAGDDRFDGGDGIDTVSYRLRREPQRRDLSHPRYERVEGLAGSDFDDTLIGDEGPNILDGRYRSDVLDGRGGDDRFVVFDRDDVTCGAGVDRLVSLYQRRDSLARPDCEEARGVPAQPISVTEDAITMRLPCFETKGYLLTTPVAGVAWWPDGPFNHLLARTTAPPSGPTGAACTVVLHRTDDAGALPRPLPVTVVSSSTGALWSFLLP